MSAFSVENPHDGKTFENYTRFEWGVEVGVVTTFMLRLFVPHEFDMCIKTVWRFCVLVLGCRTLNFGGRNLQKEKESFKMHSKLNQSNANFFLSREDCLSFLLTLKR